MVIKLFQEIIHFRTGNVFTNGLEVQNGLEVNEIIASGTVTADKFKGKLIDSNSAVIIDNTAGATIFTGSLSGNATSATKLKDAVTIGSAITPLLNGARATSAEMNVNFNGTGNVELTPLHVGISCKSKAIVDTTIISAAERADIATNKSNITTQTGRIDTLLNGVDNLNLDTIKEIGDFLSGTTAGGLVESLSKKLDLGNSGTPNAKTDILYNTIQFSQKIKAPAGLEGKADTATKLHSTFRLGTNLSTDNKGDEDYVEIDGSQNKELKPKMVGLTVASNGTHTLLGGNAASSAAAYTDNMIMTAAEHAKLAQFNPGAGSITQPQLQAAGAVLAGATQGNTISANHPQKMESFFRFAVNTPIFASGIDIASGHDNSPTVGINAGTLSINCGDISADDITCDSLTASTGAVTCVGVIFNLLSSI